LGTNGGVTLKLRLTLPGTVVLTTVPAPSTNCFEPGTELVSSVAVIGVLTAVLLH
jgi:hypothetical protein